MIITSGCAHKTALRSAVAALQRRIVFVRVHVRRIVRVHFARVRVCDALRAENSVALCNLPELCAHCCCPRTHCRCRCAGCDGVCKLVALWTVTRAGLSAGLKLCIQYEFVYARVCVCVCSTPIDKRAHDWRVTARGGYPSSCCARSHRVIGNHRQL